MPAQPARADPGERPRLAFIGVGRMGLPMCARLTGAGFHVIATDVRGDRQAGAEATGARWAGSIPAACANAQIAITMLSGVPEVQDAAAEIVGSLSPGACWLDMSTGSPSAGRRIAGLAAQRGVRAIEAPVGGGPEQARDGRLLAFAGGASEDLRRCHSVLETLCSEVLHVGPAGAGYTVKLLVNLLWFGQAVATAEALSLAGAAGLDLDVVHGALARSAAASRFITDYVGPLLDGDDLPSFPLARCSEELDSALAMGTESDVPLELAATVSALYRQALEHYGERDGELLGARYVADRAGIVLTHHSAGPSGSPSAARPGRDNEPTAP